MKAAIITARILVCGPLLVLALTTRVAFMLTHKADQAAEGLLNYFDRVIRRR